MWNSLCEIHVTTTAKKIATATSTTTTARRIRQDTNRHDTKWHDTTRHDTARRGAARHGTATTGDATDTTRHQTVDATLKHGQAEKEKEMKGMNDKDLRCRRMCYRRHRYRKPGLEGALFLQPAFVSSGGSFCRGSAAATPCSLPPP